MTYESCESKVANLLQKLSDSPKSDVNGKFALLEEILSIQETEISSLNKKLAETPKIMVYDDGGRKLGEAKELQLHFEGESFIWFRAKIAGPNGTADHVDTYWLKGEV